MKNEIMSTKRYEQVLDLLENDKNAFKKLTQGEKREISRDSYAMKIAIATDVRNMENLAHYLRHNKDYMKDIIRGINPSAMAYCSKSWFLDRYFVEFCKSATKEFSRGNKEVQGCYNDLLNMQIKKAKTKNQGIER